MDPNTQVQTYQGVTRVFVPSAEFFKDVLASASASAAAAAMAEADVRSNAAIAAAAAALLSVASLTITVDASLVVRPEDHGGANAVGLAAAAAVAAAAAGEVALSPGTTYLIDRDVVIPVGVNVRGPASATVKRIDQVATTLTSGFTTGTGSKTFTVADASGFSVGQTVMFANTTTHVVSPNDSFSHVGRVITAKSGSSITIGAGPNVSAHAAGDVMATTCHMLRGQGSNILQGFTVDGNAANNLYAHWITSATIVQEGDGVRKIGLIIQNTPSDAFLAGGPSGGQITGAWTLHCKFLNIGGNGTHYGNAHDFFVFGNRMIDGNMRWTNPVEQGGGASTGLGHQDGAIVYSNDCYNLIATGNIIQNWLKGVGAMGTTSTVINDKAIVTDNEFVNCYRPLEVTNRTQQVIFTGNRCIADFPFVSGAMRWDSQTIYVDVLNGGTYAGVPRPQGIIVANNYIKNGTIRLVAPYGHSVAGNTIENRDMNGASYTGNANVGMDLLLPVACSVRGNIVLGGYAGLVLSNSQSAAFGLDNVIEGNLFINQYQIGLSATAVAGPVQALVKNNVFRASSSAAKADETTAIPIAASWGGANIVAGMVFDGNRAEFDVSGAVAWTNGDNAAYFGRTNNVVNGLREVPATYANDSAAATGGVPVGGFYRNGSIRMQRVS